MNRTASRNWPVLLLLLAAMVALFSPILFTTKIVRASDILNEFYWGVYDAYGKPLWSLLRVDLSSAGWNPYINSGHSNDGGMVSMQFLYLYRLVFGLIPAPASVAWFMVLHLFLGGVGTYYYCRLVGSSRWGALFGGLVFALCTENVSLINAGHVMKIATIAHAPWVLYFLEKGLRSRRWLHYLAAGLVLAFQFFNTHWQISFYTCLAVAVYLLVRLLAGGSLREKGRDLLMTAVMTLFFLCAVAISLAPLASWARDTNRGVHSGANQGKGGLARDEAMMWSLPPEETVALVIPGLLGLSRQEAGDRPAAGQVYYWGRMVFTQTASYFGLLPWLLLPLPLLRQRDRITTAALCAVVGGLLFSMGNYTPFYHLLYDYLPGIDRFRVPKMMLFITAFGLAVLTARGIDLLRDERQWRSPQIKPWLAWVLAFPLLLTLLLLIEQLFGATVREWIFDLLARPTRYENDAGLAMRRWANLEQETGIALALASLHALLLLALVRRRLTVGIGTVILLALLVGDLWRVNRQFLVLTDPPKRLGQAASPAMQWIKEQGHVTGVTGQSGKQGGEVPHYRTLLLGTTDPMRYAAAKLPVLFTANAVQKRRWQEYLDIMSFRSALPDMMNVRWLVYGQQAYQRDQDYFAAHYQPVFSGGGEVVLENRQVLPKAWLVNRVEVLADSGQRLKRLQQASFDPAHTAVVESHPLVPLVASEQPGVVTLQLNQAERMVLAAETATTSLLVVGEKYYQGWQATVNGKSAPIVPVNHILRGVYLPPGSHTVEFRFDPLPFKIGTWLTLGAFALFALIAVWEWVMHRNKSNVA
jgi:hypothetical protein